MGENRENKIKIMSLRELLGMNFFIPIYQRGYRWTLQQVKDLLDDLKDFTKDVEDSDYHKNLTFYCLQPIVVKKMTAEEKNEKKIDGNKEWFEVIDGQQRLTTLLLLMNVYKNTLDSNELPTSFYNIAYERELLKEEKLLDNLEEITEVETRNIDRFHLSQALLYMRDWKKKRLVNAGKFCNTLLDYKLDDGNPPRDKAKNARIIWYEAVDENPIEVFTRLNIGKISLTNSELIKALFLNSGNLKDYGPHVKLRQQEIASEWDKIENMLQDDSFWHFLHDANYSHPTRIDFIFDMIKKENLLNLSPEELEECGTDEYSTFRYFYTYFPKNKGEKSLNECWAHVKKYFMTFKEWFDDIELYHYMGYLMYFNSKDIHQFVELWQSSENKDDFKEAIKGKILEKINKCLPLDKKYHNQRDAFNLILFHNIQTSINQNKVKVKGSKADTYRFPFNFLKKEKWDVEHINSNTTNSEDGMTTKEEWLVNVYLSMPEDLQKKIDDYFKNKKEDVLEQLYEEVKTRVPQIAKWTSDDKNMIWNYTLLDSSTNRSYGNAIFSAKRRIIIDKDSGKETEVPVLKDGKLEFNSKKKNRSTFVPPVTRQIFLKYYTPMAGDNNYWDKETDAKGYLEDLQECVDTLYGKQKEKDEKESQPEKTE